MMGKDSWYWADTNNFSEKSPVSVPAFTYTINPNKIKEKITEMIKIVLPKNMRKKIDLMTIQKDWR